MDVVEVEVLHQITHDHIVVVMVTADQLAA